VVQLGAVGGVETGFALPLKEIHMKRSPVKKKIKSPPKADDAPKKEEPKQMAIVQRKHLLGLLQNATDIQLRELYQQTMGIKWKHGVAELGCHIREILTRRKYSTET
jgi:hypothetical protein